MGSRWRGWELGAIRRRLLPSSDTLIDQPWKIMSIARRDWTTIGHSM
jgi:hypothetical protein